MIDISGHLRPIRKEIGFLDEKQELLVNCCGYQKFLTKNFSRLREHGRLDYQLIYITNGFGEFLIDNQIKKFGAGSVILYLPGIKQSYTYYAADQPEVYWVHFTGSKVHELLQKMDLLSHSHFSIGIDDSCICLFKK
jgi:AraC-like ligand binding domain.